MNELTYLTKDQIDEAVKSLPTTMDVYQDAKQMSIRSEKAYEAGIEFKNGIKTLIKKIKDTFSPMRKSADQLHKLIVRIENEQLERPKDALFLVQSALLRYERIETAKREALERKKQEELRKAEEERRAREQEELRRQAAEEQERLRKQAVAKQEELKRQAAEEAARLKKEGDKTEAARLKKEAEERAAELEREAEEQARELIRAADEQAEELKREPVIVPQVSLRDKTKKAGIQYRDNWKYRVLNSTKLATWLWENHPEMLIVDQVAFGKFVRAVKNNLTIPGAEVYNDRRSI